MSNLAISVDPTVWDFSLASFRERRARVRMPGQSAVGVVPVMGDEWDELAGNFDDVIAEQTAVFNESRWGSDNVETICFRHHGEVVGGGCVLVRSLPILKTGMAIIKWGPVWRKSGEQPTRERLKDILQAIREEYCVRRKLHLTIMPFADPVYAEMMSEVLSELDFRAGGMLAAPERYLVNTAIDAKDLKASLSQKWRYNLKKALKNDFEIRFADDADGFETFMALYRQMLERKQFLDSSAIGSLADLVATRHDAIRPRIVLVSHQGKVTAGGVFEFSGERANYLFGATDDRALGLKAGYALHWWVAEKLCAMEKVHWYDLGGNDIDPGLHQFKKGFVGKKGHVLVTPPRYHTSATFMAALVGRSVFAARSLKAQLTRLVHDLMKRRVA